MATRGSSSRPERGELVVVDSSTEAFLGKVKLKSSMFKGDKKGKKEWHTLEKCDGMDSVQGKIQVGCLPRTR